MLLRFLRVNVSDVGVRQRLVLRHVQFGRATLIERRHGSSELLLRREDVVERAPEIGEISLVRRDEISV